MKRIAVQKQTELHDSSTRINKEQENYPQPNLSSELTNDSSCPSLYSGSAPIRIKLYAFPILRTITSAKYCLHFSLPESQRLFCSKGIHLLSPSSQSKTRHTIQQTSAAALEHARISFLNIGARCSSWRRADAAKENSCIPHFCSCKTDRAISSKQLLFLPALPSIEHVGVHPRQESLFRRWKKQLGQALKSLREAKPTSAEPH